MRRKGRSFFFFGEGGSRDFLLFREEGERERDRRPRNFTVSFKRQREGGEQSRAEERDTGKVSCVS